MEQITAPRVPIGPRRWGLELDARRLAGLHRLSAPVRLVEKHSEPAQPSAFGELFLVTGAFGFADGTKGVRKEPADDAAP